MEIKKLTTAYKNYRKLFKERRRELEPDATPLGINAFADYLAEHGKEADWLWKPDRRALKTQMKATT